MDNYHVLVSGAGAIGLSAACLLAQSGYNVLTIDSRTKIEPKGTLGAHLRSTALSPASLNFLKDLNVDTREIGQKIEKMTVWERDGTGSITFHPEETPLPYLAINAEQDDLIERISIVAQNRVEIRRGIQIVEVSNQGFTKLSDGQSLIPELLIIAEGPESATCNLLGVKKKLKNLNQHALATVVRTEKAHENQAIQRFGPTPFALLPLLDSHLLSLIWTLDEDRFRNICTMDDAQFVDRAASETERYFGSIVKVDKRASFPLTHNLVTDFNPKPNVLVLGDSAHTIHPLAGQGFNLGLEDVRGMASVLERQPERLNLTGLWRTFNFKRQLRVSSMMGLMEAFSNVWRTNRPYLRWLRNVGVRAVNQSKSLKQQLIMEAMGLGPMAEDL